jgi:hypothetical protein
MLQQTHIREFWNQVHCDDDHLCWHWEGPIHPLGGAPEFAYRIGDVVLTRRARGVAYQLAHGWDSISTGSYVYASCGGSLCVNPFHLKLGHTIVDAQGLTRAQSAAWERFQGSLSREELDQC